MGGRDRPGRPEKRADDLAARLAACQLALDHAQGKVREQSGIIEALNERLGIAQERADDLERALRDHIHRPVIPETAR